MRKIKKRIFIFIFTFLLTLSGVYASDKVHVSILEEFNTANPASSIDVVVLEDTAIGSNMLKENDVLHCKITKVTDPKRGKRSASFSVYPVSYTSNGEVNKINGSFYGKYTSKIVSEKIKNIDPKKVGTKAAKTVGNHFIKGVAPAISLAEGMIKNEDGNRIESGVKQVYKDSPLSFVEKGEELDLKEGTNFYLIFKPASEFSFNETDENSEE